MGGGVFFCPSLLLGYVMPVNSFPHPLRPQHKYIHGSHSRQILIIKYDDIHKTHNQFSVHRPFCSTEPSHFMETSVIFEKCLLLGMIVGVG